MKNEFVAQLAIAASTAPSTNASGTRGRIAPFVRRLARSTMRSRSPATCSDPAARARSPSRSSSTTSRTRRICAHGADKLVELIYERQCARDRPFGSWSPSRRTFCEERGSLEPFCVQARTDHEPDPLFVAMVHGLQRSGGIVRVLSDFWSAALVDVSGASARRERRTAAALVSLRCARFAQSTALDTDERSGPTRCGGSPPATPQVQPPQSRLVLTCERARVDDEEGDLPARARSDGASAMGVSADHHLHARVEEDREEVFVRRDGIARSSVRACTCRCDQRRGRGEACRWDVERGGRAIPSTSIVSTRAPSSDVRVEASASRRCGSSDRGCANDERVGSRSMCRCGRHHSHRRVPVQRTRSTRCSRENASSVTRRFSSSGERHR